MRRQATDWEKVFTKDISNKDYYPKHTKNFQNSTMKIQITCFKKETKTLIDTSPKDVYRCLPPKI